MQHMKDQVREMAPSAKEPLFRRLMVEESLAYLREKRGIIGFEVQMSVDQSLSGFALIAIQKHTLYAFCSDLDEPPKLILFPSLGKLFDTTFALLPLQVTKKLYGDASFRGRTLETGSLGDLVKSLTPPVKSVDISRSVTDLMAKQMYEPVVTTPAPAPPTEVASVSPVTEVHTEPMEEPPYDGLEEAGYDDYDGYDNYDTYESTYEDYDTYVDPIEDVAPLDTPIEDEPPVDTPAEDERTLQLKAQTFASLAEISEYCANVLEVPRPIAVNVVNKALQSNVDPEFRIALAIRLFAKLFDAKKL